MWKIGMHESITLDGLKLISGDGQFQVQDYALAARMIGGSWIMHPAHHAVRLTELRGQAGPKVGQVGFDSNPKIDEDVSDQSEVPMERALRICLAVDGYNEFAST